MLKTSTTPISVGITLGGGVDLAITKDGRLFVIDYTGYTIDLGKATKNRFDQVIEYAQRLKINAIEE